MTDSTGLPEFADVEAAAARIAAHAYETPLIENAALNETLGGRVFLKLESLQRTGSFKFRGACNRISLIPESERRGGVVAFSSGNHAQGVAAAAQMFAISAVIVMPKDAPRAKIEGTKALGAEIVFYDRLTQDREAIAARIREERGATLVRPFDDAGIVAGQGTIGLEIVRQAASRGVSKLDAVLVPCSGGGVVSGIALALSGASPHTRAISVEPERFDGMRMSLAAGERSTAPGGALSMADALMAPTPGKVPFALAKRLMRCGLAVSDRELAAAVAYAATVLKLIIEPGGSAGLAALLAGRYDVHGKSVAVVLTGGNCDFETVAACVARMNVS
ncbi:MAG TPA: threonine/serine dehydratase [Rhizomicrobium sp.]|jgi:threonine dehydratase|nr:threonine/serine dehydratase [Rhizomicrobium sp.]